MMPCPVRRPSPGGQYNVNNACKVCSQWNAHHALEPFEIAEVPGNPLLRVALRSEG